MSTQGKGIGGHHRHDSVTDSWITPRWVIEATGLFDLDPCEASPQPWPTAKTGYSLERNEDGLILPWTGTVFVNPPYSNPESWAQKLAEHGNGLLLTFARVETRWWHDWVWPFAGSVWFPKGRLTFHYPDGRSAAGNSGAPSAFAGYGDRAVSILETLRAKFGGALCSGVMTGKGFED